MTAVDRFVLGCAQIGGLYEAIDDATATATLEAAWEGGIRHFDTAPHYGAGLSERRLGTFLRQVPRDSFTISTKVGRLLVDTADDTDGDAGFYGGDRRRRILDYSADGVLRSLEDSLTRLGLDRVDTVYLHDPDNHVDEAIAAAMPALLDLRSQGVVDHVGAGMNTVAPLVRLVRETAADTLMLAGRYTLLDRTADEELLPLCVAQGVNVVAAAVFNGGLLAGPGAPGMYDYQEAPGRLIELTRRLESSCSAHGVPLRAAALQFALRHDAVGAIAVGCRTAKHVEDNLSLLDVPVPESVWKELDSIVSSAAATWHRDSIRSGKPPKESATWSR